MLAVIHTQRRFLINILVVVLSFLTANQLYNIVQGFTTTEEFGTRKVWF